jgi:serine/threonine protein kinase
MELAEGNLEDLLSIYRQEFGTPIAQDYACMLLAQAAAALDFLNTRQHMINSRCVAIQHRDIKPSNLLLFGDRVKVADFGLVSSIGSPVQEGRKGGTLDFCAPEVFQGRLSDKTDQYALAVTYCILRTGHVPFHDTPDSFRSDYVRPTPDLGLLQPAEQHLVARALAKEPHHRWGSCGEFMTRLTRVVEPEPCKA